MSCLLSQQKVLKGTNLASQIIAKKSNCKLRLKLCSINETQINANKKVKKVKLKSVSLKQENRPIPIC